MPGTVPGRAGKKTAPGGTKRRVIGRRGGKRAHDAPEHPPEGRHPRRQVRPGAGRASSSPAIRRIVRLCLMQKARDRARGLAHRRLRHRLSRLAARRPRPAVPARRDAVPSQTTSCSRPASTRIWRRPRCGARSRRSCAARAASTACSASGTARARRRPLRRRVPPRQCRRHLAARRRAGADGRRPHRGKLDHRAPVRVQSRQLHDPDPQSRRACRRSSTTASSAGRCRAIAGAWVGLKCLNDTVESTAVIDGALDRVNVVIPADPCELGGGRRSACPRAGSISACTTACWPGSAAAGVQARRHARLRARQPAQPHDHLRRAQRRGSASSRRARAISTCARRSTISASTRCAATISACRLYKVGCPWPIEPRRHAGVRRTGSTSSSSSRRSAR